MEKKYLELPIELKEVNKESFTLDAIFSSDNVDRHLEVVEQNFDLKAFKKNPVLLNSHNYGDATEVIGKISPIGVKEGKLQGKVKFAVNENPKAKIIFDLYAGGFLNAFSIGFMPLEMDEKSGNITKSELLEVSAVAVPANAMALAKSKGIDVESICEHKNWIKDKGVFKCAKCGKLNEEEKEEKKEEVVEEKEVVEIETKKQKQIKALKRIIEKREKKRNEILKEVLAVTQRLQKGEVEAEKKRQMANRIIRQMTKIKKLESEV
jgi:hypothetical protein